MITLEIYNPITGKGIDKKHTASLVVENEENYVDIGVVVRDEKGVSLCDRKVVITATDSEQNKTLESTGAEHRNREVNDGHKIPMYYYPFHYEFRTEGKHKITFTCEGVKESVEFQVEKEKKSKKDK